MSIFSKLGSLLRPSAKSVTAQKSFAVEQFVYVKIPGDVGPIDRGTLFENPIDSALAIGSLGAVLGGGSSLGEERSDGTRPIEFCGIDIDTTNRDGALSILRTLLPSLNAPIGTELHYTVGSERLQDELSPEGWLLSKPRTLLHPGFGV